MPCGPQQPVKGIPADRIDHFRQTYLDDIPPPLSLTVTREDGGSTFTLTAIYPPCEDTPTADAPFAGASAIAAGVVDGIGLGAFPAAIVAAAQKAGRTWDIPVSVALAQWALESNWGAHMPVGSNNPFAVKAVDTQPFVEAEVRDIVDGIDTVRRQTFRMFDSLDQAFDEHGRLLATNRAFARAMALRDDPPSFANALTGVYADDGLYGTHLNTLMIRYRLQIYDV